jgi:hypothetical protein
MAFFSLRSIIFDEGGKYNNLKGWVYIIFLIVQKIFFSSGDTISKILLTNKFLLPHYLMFYKSLIVYIFFIILIPTLFLTSKIKYNKYESLLNVGDPHILLLFKLMTIVLSFFACFSIYKIIDIFTPIHVGFINVSSSLFQAIGFIIFGDEMENLIYLILDIICLLVIAFGTLIFTEILIINACRLNEYTQEGLLLKEQLDQMPPDATIFFDDEEYHQNKENKIDSQNIERLNKTMQYTPLKYI